ncbi:MAG: hypothetical protein COA61_001890 [Zetaproteobacteria bacterium]|nr:hypothetical protein [Zetaproteobacteria bacterium]
MMPWILLLSVFGLVLNLAFAESLIQPDWSLGLLLGALLAHRGYWPWVFAGTALHDLVLHWSPFITLPWVMITPLVMIWSDAQVGASLVQRFVILGFLTLILWIWDWLPEAALLTFLLATVIWHFVAQKHAKPA